MNPKTHKRVPFNHKKFLISYLEKEKKFIDENGWMHSGDLAVMNQEGYVKITGRLKDMIIRGGENIYPREIEEFLFTHPKIAEAYGVGVPDKHYGEQVMVWVKLKENSSVTEDDIKAFCKGKIMDYKIPKYVKKCSRRWC